MRWLLLVLVGCYRPTPQAGAPCGPDDTCPNGLACIGGFCGGGATEDGGRDSATDATIVPPDGCVTFSTQVDTCTLAPGGALTLTGFHTYDTDTHELRDNNGALVPTTSTVITGLAGPIDVLVVQSFTSTNTIRVVGATPFGVISYGNISLTGTIDASGKDGGGAGSRGFATCGTALGKNGTTNAPGSSGGGGGAFRGNGGEGGEGDENGTIIAAGAGGSAVPAIPAGPLGGCRGGTGGGGTNIGGPPGQGGGAVYLAAFGSIDIGGTIDAGGGGGDHGNALSGAGGGGGSGGMIVLEGASVTVNGILVANGGGGGGGADDVAGNNGTDGANGRRDASRAAGGDGFDAAMVAEGGNGGQGGAGNSINGSPSSEDADNGGGGGGGGCGFIAIGSANANTNAALISPSLSTWPTP